MATRKMQVAVITGDIHGFTRLSSLKRRQCLSALKACFAVLKENRKENSLWKNPEIFRGDGFQLVLTQPVNALIVGLQLKSYLEFDIKISIGIGRISSLDKRTGESNGEAFQLSGRTLDKMNYSSISTLITTNSSEINDEMETYCYLLEGITSRWTVIQKDVVFYKLLGYTETDIAEVLRISQPTVNAHSKAANWRAIERLLSRTARVIPVLK